MSDLQDEEQAEINFDMAVPIQFNALGLMIGPPPMRKYSYMEDRQPRIHLE